MATTDQLWQTFSQQILKIAAPNFDPKAQQFSVASSTLSVDLGNADPAIVNAELYNLGNTIPAPSPAYAPCSALLTGFQSFLDAIDLKGDANPNLDSQINITSGAMSASQTNFQSVTTQAITGWTAYKQINPAIGFSDYVTQQYPVYIQAKNDLDAKTSAWQQLMTQKYGQGYELIANARNRLSATGGASDITMQNAYNMAVKAGSVAAAGSTPALPGQAPQAPANALISSFAPAFSIDGFTTQYQQWQAASAAGKTGASVHVTSEDAASDWSASGWSASGNAGFDYGFFGIWAKHSSSSSTESTFAMTSDVDVKFDFVGLSTFAINPGRWFDLGLVQRYRDQLLPKSPDFFAPTGSLARVPYQAVVGFQPTITLKLANADYSSFKSAFESQTQGAMEIGPFTIGDSSLSTYSDHTSVGYHDDSSTIVISPPPSTLPVLLGVISSRLDV